MKITIERSVFADAVAWVLRSVSSRATLPALGGILFDATSNELRLAGTDLELASEATITAAIEEPGTVVLPGRILGDIARVLPEGAVRVETTGQQTKVTCGTAEFTLRTLAVEDFPRLPVAEGTAAGSIPADLFATAVNQVTRAASHDEARPVLTGTLIDAVADKVTLVATDSYRLAVRDIPWAGPSEQIKRVVPARALTEAARAADDAEQVTITLSESQATFEAGSRRLTTRLIEGEFPNWKQLLPTELPHQLRIEKDVFAESVKRVGVLAQSGAPVKISLEVGGAKLGAGSQDIGEATEAIEGKFEGEPLVIGFNPAYLLDGVNAIEGPEVILAVRDGLKAALVQSPDENAGFVYLVMPVRP